LNFSARLSFNDYSYDTDIIVNQREKRILKFVGFDNKKDTLLYAGKGEMLILKNENIDLQQFRVINLYDTVFSVMPLEHWEMNFYRKTLVDKKYKTFIINDLIPIGHNYFERIRYDETGYNCSIDQTL
jgi:hypothetical protein